MSDSPDSAANLAEPLRSPPERRINEHLANERTYLAWMRTSITVMGLGFVVARFGVWLRYLAERVEGAPETSRHSLSVPLGVSMVVLGALLAALGAWRYRVVRLAIEERGAAAAGGAVAIVTLVVILFAAGILVVVMRT